MSTRENLIDAVSLANTNISKDDIKAAVKLIFEHIESSLINGDRIEIRGLGSFDVKEINLPKHSYSKNPTKKVKTLRYCASENLLRKINNVY